MTITELKRRPNQTLALNLVTKEIANGVKSVCVTSPTGGGKSLMMADICNHYVSQGMRIGIYVNRKLLVKNLAEKFDEYGLSYGVEAANWEAWSDMAAPIQILSIQTVNARILNKRKKSLEHIHLQVQPFDIVIRDEAHINDYLEVLQNHRDDGAVEIGMTATPLGISHRYEKLLIAGTKSELFKYDPPALTPVHFSAIQEPDLSKVKRDSEGEYVINGKLRKAYTQHIVGDVIKHWKKDAWDRPTALFASGIPESVYLTEQFANAGITAAHIGHKQIVMDGQVYKPEQSLVDEIFERSKSGSIRVVCSRFKLREGVDLPHLSYGVLATPVGSFLSYLQMIGRLMRYHPETDETRIQDHGGSWWRHPSPNRDVDWHRYWDLPIRAISTAFQRSVSEGDTKPGITCPACGEVMGSLPFDEKCRKCKKDIPRGKPVRRVVMESGQLKDVTGFSERKNVKEKDGSQKMWDGIYWGWSKHKKDKTFGQAWAWFSKKHYETFRCYPVRKLKLMPKDELDWFRKMDDVPKERLIR